MTRFFSIANWDFRLQFRQGIFYAAVFVTVLWIILLRQLPDTGMRYLLPAAVYIELSVFGFYFMAGILYLEKGDGVLEALVITPLTTGEYLLSKVATLTLVAVVMSVAVLLGVQATGVDWLIYVVSVMANSWMLIMIGFIIAARYDAINEFLIPSILFMIPAQFPLLDYFDIWRSWLTYIILTQPTMLLMKATFEPLAPWQYVYAFAYVLITNIVVTWWANRTFKHFIIRKEGVR